MVSNVIFYLKGLCFQIFCLKLTLYFLFEFGILQIKRILYIRFVLDFMNKDELKIQLKKYFGFATFKGLQESVILNVLKKEDSFVIMPTGGGKSLCYQLPALINEGMAIVVSPLIALMKNQVDAIRGISSENGIAHVLNSSLNKTETTQVKNDIRNGVTKLLYVAPES